MANQAEAFAFSQHMQQLMSLIINTLYYIKEIFLRELISSASDAVDKIRYESVTDPEKIEAHPIFFIKIVSDKTNPWITMTKDELINDLGTIAKSGTNAFMEAMNAAGDISMISQFGGSFYSAYFFSDNLWVFSKNKDDEQHVWESAAGGSFTVQKDTEMVHGESKRGTKIICYLNEDNLELLEERRVKDLVIKHSKLIGFLIALYVEKSKEKEVTDSEEEEDEKKDEEKEGDEPKIDEVEEENEKEARKKKTKNVKDVSHGWDRLNQNKPLWMMLKSEDMTNDEYASFNTSLANSWEDHLAVKHFYVEGQLEFRALLFVLGRAPFDMFESKKKRTTIELYVRRVFIMDVCDELMLEWFSSVKGAVDSYVLPLNIFWETLHQTKILRVIKQNLVKKFLEMFADLSEEKDDYRKFYEQFSKNIKLGIQEDSTDRMKVAEFIRYHTFKSGEKQISSREYVDRMNEGQNDSYYSIGESSAAMSSSPFLEASRKKGLEVFYMVDPIDEYTVQQLEEFDWETFKSTSKGGPDIEYEDEKTKIEELKAEFEPLTKLMKGVLGDKAEKAIESSRMVDSPCVLTTAEYGWSSANMERIMNAQAKGAVRSRRFYNTATVRAMMAPVAFLATLRTCHAQEIAFTVGFRTMTSQTTTTTTTNVSNTSTTTATTTGPDDTHLARMGPAFMICAIAAIAIPFGFHLLRSQITHCFGEENMPGCLIKVNRWVVTLCFTVLLSMPGVLYVIFALDVRTNAVHKDVLTWSLSLVPIAFFTMFILEVLKRVCARWIPSPRTYTLFQNLIYLCRLVMLMASVTFYFFVGWEGFRCQHSWGAGALAWGIMLLMGMMNAGIYSRIKQAETLSGYNAIEERMLKKCLDDICWPRFALGCAKIFLNLYNLIYLWMRIPAFDTSIPGRTGLHMIAWVEVPVVCLCLFGFLLTCCDIVKRTCKEGAFEGKAKRLRHAAKIFVLLQDLSSLNALRTCSPSDLRSRWARMNYLNVNEAPGRRERRMFLFQQVVNVPFCLIVGIVALRIKMSQVIFFMEEHYFDWSFSQWITLIAFFNNVMGITDENGLRMRSMLYAYGYHETWLDYLADQVLEKRYKDTFGTFMLMSTLGPVPHVCALLNISQKPEKEPNDEFPTSLTKLAYAPGNTSIIEEIAIHLQSHDNKFVNDIFNDFFQWKVGAEHSHGITEPSRAESTHAISMQSGP